ncbi:MAG: HDOD domain-containing protein, partial [Opitutales bacterium]
VHLQNTQRVNEKTFEKRSIRDTLLPQASDPLNKETAELTVERIQTALAKDEAATVSGVIRLIHELAEKAFDISTQELADLISRDVAVTKKVIQTANKLAYNQSGAKITTVTQAINHIGFTTVRNLAISLLLIESSESQMNVTEQREVSAFALCSGFMSQIVIEEQAPELAEQSFICTTLRNYGKLLMSTFLIEDFRDAQKKALSDGEDSAFTKIFGLTPLELSYILLENAQMPDVITACLKNVPTHIIRRAAKSEIEKISVIADFSSRLCDLAMFSDLPTEEFTDALKDLLKEYSHHVVLSVKEVYQLLENVAGTTDQFCKDYSFDLIPKSLTSRIIARLNKQRPPKRNKTPVILPAKTVPERSPIQCAIEKLKTVLADPPFVASRAYMIALEAMVEEQTLDDCILFLRQGAKDVFIPAYGCGKLFFRITRKVTVNKAEPNVFGLTISKEKDVVFASAEGEKVQEFLPDWLTSFKKTRALYALPISISGKSEALILGVSWTGLFTDLEGERLQDLRSLRDCLKDIIESAASCRSDVEF